MPQTTIQRGGIISVPKRDSDELVEFPVGEDLINAVSERYSSEKFALSTQVKRYAESMDVDLRDVIGTLLGDDKELGAQTVKRFLTNTGLRPLFSPIVEDGLRLGLNRVQAQWEALIARTIPVDSMSYEYFEFNNGTPGAPPTGTEEFQLKAIGQGAPIPTARVTVSGKSYTMTKQGRGIEWTDESKQAPIDLAAMWFEQVGLQLGWDYHDQIVDSLLNGYFDDGSDDAPVIPAAGGTFTDVDLLTAVATMQTVYGYTPSVMVMSQTTAIAIQTMENSGGTYRIFPDGVEAAGLPRIVISPQMADDDILFVDTAFAMVRFVNKPFGTEFDRSVQTQVEGSYGTEISLTVPLFANARVILHHA